MKVPLRGTLVAREFPSLRIPSTWSLCNGSVNKHLFGISERAERAHTDEAMIQNEKENEKDQEKRQIVREIKTERERKRGGEKGRKRKKRRKRREKAKKKMSSCRA